ncbi:hypothetical protein ATK36_5616 [Amycolatopsis sulphurea]|uniref:Uncharacterized protein n=1 Tax=Amycolatopsis sulphurea TaxID=76022 RepID=A0A2A9FIW9_9PSEU|nr:hypothetical protein ATK36_5616 [Amycolatopsis sulphurea]
MPVIAPDGDSAVATSGLPLMPGSPRVPAKLVGDPAAGDAEACATTSWRAPDRLQVCEGALDGL